MNLSIQVSDDDTVAIIGAAVGREGDQLAAVLSGRLSRREQAMALLELLTDEEYDAVDWAPIVAGRSAHAAIPAPRPPLVLRSA